jgi:hypothetical protein
VKSWAVSASRCVEQIVCGSRISKAPFEGRSESSVDPSLSGSVATLRRAGLPLQ